MENRKYIALASFFLAILLQDYQENSYSGLFHFTIPMHISFVLLWASGLYILRHYSSRHGTDAVVGEAYVHGIECTPPAKSFAMVCEVRLKFLR
jgi:hypothetical protein